MKASPSETDEMDAEKQDQTCASCAELTPAGQEWCGACAVLRAGPYDTYYGHLGLSVWTEIRLSAPRGTGPVTGSLKIKWDEGHRALTGFFGSFSDGQFLAAGRNALSGQEPTDIVVSGTIEGPIASGWITGSFSGVQTPPVPFSASRVIAEDLVEYALLAARVRQDTISPPDPAVPLFKKGADMAMVMLLTVTGRVDLEAILSVYKEGVCEACNGTREVEHDGWPSECPYCVEEKEK